MSGSPAMPSWCRLAPGWATPGSGPDRPGLEPAQTARRHLEGHHGARLDVTGAVGDGRAVEGDPVAGPVLDDPEAPRVVELATSPTSGQRPAGTGPAVPSPMVGSDAIVQWTILARASSMMSVAPRSLRAGISTLISDLGTTVSTANPSAAEELRDRRRPQ